MNHNVKNLSSPWRAARAARGLQALSPGAVCLFPPWPQRAPPVAGGLRTWPEELTGHLQDTYRKPWLRVVRVYPPTTASPARSYHRGWLVGFSQKQKLLGFLWYFSILLMFFLFFPSEKEGPCSTRPNHPVCGHTQPLLAVLPLKGSLGLGLDTVGEAPWRSLCTHTPEEMGRRGRERPPHVAGDVPLPSHHVRTPGGFLRAQGCSPRGGQHVVEAYGEDGQV